MAVLANKIAGILTDLGLRRDGVAFVHSGIGAIAELDSAPVGPREATMALHNGLTSVLGKSGTIATPAYFYDYARYDTTLVVEKSPPDKSLGLPRFLFAQPLTH